MRKVPTDDSKTFRLTETITLRDRWGDFPKHLYSTAASGVRSIGDIQVMVNNFVPEDEILLLNVVDGKLQVVKAKFQKPK